MVKHLIGNGKVRPKHFPAKLNLPIGIKITGAAVLRNLAGEIKINS